MVRINELAPEFRVKAFHNNRIINVKLSDYKGKWVILFFYPADFTFVCPTELGALADKYEELKMMGVDVLSLSTDTEYVHKAWFDSSKTIQKIKFPMLADPSGQVCKVFGTYIENEGLSLRGTFFIDPEGYLRAYEIHDNTIGRNVDEIVRKVKALKFISRNPERACPVNWQEGEETLKPGLDLVGKI